MEGFYHSIVLQLGRKDVARCRSTRGLGKMWIGALKEGTNDGIVGKGVRL